MFLIVKTLKLASKTLPLQLLKVLVVFSVSVLVVLVFVNKLFDILVSARLSGNIRIISKPEILYSF